MHGDAIELGMLDERHHRRPALPTLAMPQGRVQPDSERRRHTAQSRPQIGLDQCTGRRNSLGPYIKPGGDAALPTGRFGLASAREFLGVGRRSGRAVVEQAEPAQLGKDGGAMTSGEALDHQAARAVS